MPTALVRTMEVLGCENRIHREVRSRACRQLDLKVQELVQEGYFGQDEIFRAADKIFSKALPTIGRGGEVTLFSLDPNELPPHEQRKVKLFGILLKATQELTPYVKTHFGFLGLGSQKRDFVAVAPSLTVRRVVRLGLFRNGNYVGDIHSPS